jgi:hypothetical protein
LRAQQLVAVRQGMALLDALNDRALWEDLAEGVALNSSGGIEALRARLAAG